MARHRHDPLKDLVGFLLGDVMYAVRIEVVREIVNPLPIVDLPRAPSSVRGVADYRGEVVPVVDLRDRFGLPAVQASRKTKWVVVDVTGSARPKNSPSDPTSGSNPATFRSPNAIPSDAPPRALGFAAETRLGESGGISAGRLATNTASPARSPNSGARKGLVNQACYAALVVDSVTEVFGLGGGGLRPPPPHGFGGEEPGIEGVTAFGTRLVFVLDARAFGPVTHAALSWAPASSPSLERP